GEGGGEGEEGAGGQEVKLALVPESYLEVVRLDGEEGEEEGEEEEEEGEDGNGEAEE
ncbi:hypothetical protein H0H93_005912, partial [Arthromyces matolae]